MQTDYQAEIAETSALNKELPKFAYIDAMRGIAIMGVLMVHVGQYGSSFKYLPTIIISFLNSGARGVQLFFVASALTLFMSMGRRKENESQQLLPFFIRRFFRIAPVYYLGIIYYSLWYLIIGKQMFSLENIVSNIFFVHGFSPSWINSLVPGGWSITVEMCFYCLVPFLFSKVKNINQAISFLLITVLFNTLISYALKKMAVGVENDSLESYLALYLPNQLPVFAVGFIVYFIIDKSENVRSNIRPINLALLAIVGYVSLSVGMPYIHIYLLYGVCFGLFAISLSKHSFKFFVNPLTIFFGKVSFSLYIVHFAVLFAMREYHLDDYIQVNGISTALINYALRYALVCVIGLPIAMLVHRWIETPCQSAGKALINRITPVRT